MRRWMFATTLGLAMATSFAGTARACPMCKDSIPNAENTDPAEAGTVPVGFNYSVYYMLGGLFLCIGLSVTGLVKGARDTTRLRGEGVSPTRSPRERQE
jgi:hypothetical protein